MAENEQSGLVKAFMWAFYVFFVTLFSILAPAVLLGIIFLRSYVTGLPNIVVLISMAIASLLLGLLCAFLFYKLTSSFNALMIGISIVSFVTIALVAATVLAVNEIVILLTSTAAGLPNPLNILLTEMPHFILTSTIVFIFLVSPSLVWTFLKSEDRYYFTGLYLITVVALFLLAVFGSKLIMDTLITGTLVQ